MSKEFITIPVLQDFFLEKPVGELKLDLNTAKIIEAAADNYEKGDSTLVITFGFKRNSGSWTLDCCSLASTPKPPALSC